MLTLHSLAFSPKQGREFAAPRSVAPRLQRARFRRQFTFSIGPVHLFLSFGSPHQVVAKRVTG